MRVTSIIAIYCLFWVLSAMLVLPIGNRTHSDEEAEGKDSGMVPGQAASAPLNFRPRLIVKRATALSVVLFGLFYLNYVNGWITADDLNYAKAAPDLKGRTS